MGMRGCRGAKGEKRPREEQGCETRGGAGHRQAQGEAGGALGQGASGETVARWRVARAGSPGEAAAAGAREAEARPRAGAGRPRPERRGLGGRAGGRERGAAAAAQVGGQVGAGRAAWTAAGVRTHRAGGGAGRGRVLLGPRGSGGGAGAVPASSRPAERVEAAARLCSGVAPVAAVAKTPGPRPLRRDELPER